MMHAAKRTYAFLIGSLMMFPGLMLARSHKFVPVVQPQSVSAPDTATVRRISPELTLPQDKMTSSPRPVEVRQLGRHLRVKSRSIQLLPVYTAQGSYYASFRLLKGTNWITGLPRGAYYINHRKYTIN